MVCVTADASDGSCERMLENCSGLMMEVSARNSSSCDLSALRSSSLEQIAYRAHGPQRAVRHGLIHLLHTVIDVVVGRVVEVLYGWTRGTLGLSSGADCASQLITGPRSCLV